VGYVAGAGHDEDLLILYRAVKPMLGEIELVVRYGGFRPSWLEPHPSLDFKQVSWHISQYPQELYNLNIDLFTAPLRDREFNRCKSNLKWLEAASMGVTLLASDVEPFKKTRGDIYLVDNDIDAWQKAIRYALKHPFKQKVLMSKCAENYSLKAEAESVVKFLESVV
jgi:glycosyltransferase involved in cell wall biosynthesis